MFPNQLTVFHASRSLSGLYMEMIPLQATARATDVTVKDLRRGDQVPCELYGNDKANVSLQCVYNEIFRAYQLAGESTIVNLNTGNGAVPVLFHAIQVDPVSDRIIHVDFYAVNMKKEIDATIPIRFEGEAPAVEDLNGVLVTTRDHVNVRCMPSNLPHDLEVSLNGLVDFQTTLTVADIVVPEGVEITEESDLVLAVVQEQRKEEAAVTEASTDAEAPAGESSEKSAGSDSGDS